MIFKWIVPDEYYLFSSADGWFQLWFQAIRDSSGHLCSNKFFVTMDNISVICRHSMLCWFLTWIVFKVHIFFVFVIINDSKHVQTYGESRDFTQFYKVAQLHKLCWWANYVSAKNYENWLAVNKVIGKISRFTFLAHPV